MNVQPFIRTPFTDIFGAVHTFQGHRHCAMHELRVVDCMEAYGVRRGLEKCNLLLEDFRECVQKGKQGARCDIMVAERQRQWKAGERKQRYADDIAPGSY